MDHAGKMQRIHKGIMVVKAVVEETNLKDKGNQNGKDEPLTQLRKYIRTYYPAWRQKNFYNDNKRLQYQTSIELKTKYPNFENRSKQATSEDAEQLIEHEIKVTSDCNLFVQCLIVKGIQGEQHKVFEFNPENLEAFQVSNRAGDTDLEFNMNAHIR